MKVKIVFNKGYYIKNIVKNYKSFYKILLINDYSPISLNNNLELFYSNNNLIFKNTLQCITNKKNIITNILNINELDVLNDIQKECYNRLISDWNTEINLNLLGNSNTNIALYPIYLHYKDYTFRMDIYLKIYDDGYSIFTYSLEFDVDNYQKFDNIKHTIYYENILSIDFPISYLEFKDRPDISDSNSLNNTYYLNVQYANYNIDKLFYDLLKILCNNKHPYLGYSRTTYMLDTDEIPLKQIDKLLSGTELECKNINLGKDYRPFNDYYHYANEVNVVIYGNNILNTYTSPNQSKEEYIIYQVIKDKITLDKINNNKLSYKELKKLRRNYLLEENRFNYSNFGEVDDYIKDIFFMINKNNIVNNINKEIDIQLEEKRIKFENVISIIGIFLASPTIITNVINPILLFIKHKYNIPTINNFPYDMCIYLLTNLILYILLKIIRKK